MAQNSRSPSLLPKKSRSLAHGIPKRLRAMSSCSVSRFGGGCLENGSAASKPLVASSTARASLDVRAKIETQSSERQAGTTPRVLMRPRVGLSPSTLLNAAGTRPDPAVSVPSAKLTSPAATATHEPELDPPEMYPLRSAHDGAPLVDRVPLRPFANWSRLVLPIGMAPAEIKRSTA